MPSRGLARTTAPSTTLSAYWTVTEPSASLAKLPVSMERVRPPIWRSIRIACIEAMSFCRLRGGSYEATDGQIRTGGQDEGGRLKDEPRRGPPHPSAFILRPSTVRVCASVAAGLVACWSRRRRMNEPAADPERKTGKSLIRNAEHCSAAVTAAAPHSAFLIQHSALKKPGA